MITIGMDVHVRNSYLHVTDEAGNVLRHGRCRNATMDLAKFLGPLEQEARQRGEPIRVVLESTTNSRAIQRLLMQYGEAAGIDLTAEVLDARKIRIIAESVCKCDRLDGKVLCELARSNLQLPTCYMPDDEEFALREHLRARNDLVRMRTMLKNRVHAVLHRRGILAPVATLFTKTGRAYLAQLDLETAGREIFDRFCTGAIRFVIVASPVYTPPTVPSSNVVTLMSPVIAPLTRKSVTVVAVISPTIAPVTSMYVIVVADTPPLKSPLISRLVIVPATTMSLFISPPKIPTSRLVIDSAITLPEMEPWTIRFKSPPVPEEFASTLRFPLSEATTDPELSDEW